MEELEKFIRKENQKKYLEIFLILDQISKKENIISFNFSKGILTVQIGINDYYRIWLNKEVKKC